MAMFLSWSLNQNKEQLLTGGNVSAGGWGEGVEVVVGDDEAVVRALRLFRRGAFRLRPP